MTTVSNKKLTRLSVLLLALLIGVNVVQVSAQSNGIGITPRKEYVVKPGEKTTDTLYVSNLSTSQALRVRMEMLDFTAKDESGTPALQLNTSAPQTPWSLKPFLKFPAEVTIPAGKSANVPITVNIPAGQGAGSYYGAIKYLAENAETKQKVNIAASSVSLLFVTVPGQAREQMALKDFGAFATEPDGTAGKIKSLFTGKQPDQLAYRIQNNGNVAERPEGSIVVKNMFGKTVAEIERANPKSQLALISQTRRIDLCIKSEVVTKTDPSTGQQSQETKCKNAGLLPGRYTAQISLFYGMNGTTNQEVGTTATFWYLPLWFIIAAIILLLVLAFAIWSIYRRITRPRRGYFRR